MKKTTTAYPSRKSVTKLTLSQVIAKLLATGETDRTLGRFSLGRRKLFNDPLHRRGDPFLVRALTLDQEIEQRLKCYEGLARSALFSYGVQKWIDEMPTTKLDEEIAARNLSTEWRDRQSDRSAKERLLMRAIVSEQ